MQFDLMCLTFFYDRASVRVSLRGGRSKHNTTDSAKLRITSKDLTLKIKGNLPTAVNSLEPTRAARN